MELLITPQGTIRCLYDETLPLAELGLLTIQRGSHLEPTSQGEWTADLSPVGAPLLGPFSLRTDALRAEVDWLLSHWLLSTPPLCQESTS
jgi:hypothetical protein